MEINCLKIANDILEKSKNGFLDYLKLGRQITVVALVLDGNQESLKYAEIKKRFAEKIGINFSIVFFSTENELITLLKQLNDDDSIIGYILQFPLPKTFNIYKIIDLIDYKKDIDGISIDSILNNYLGYVNSDKLLPCTVQAVLKVLESLKINLKAKKIVIINRSLIIGKPLLNSLINLDATVTVCHEKTSNLKKCCKEADIIISAIGKPNFFDEGYVNNNSIIIDCGISYFNNKLVGDFNSKKISNIVRYYTPVPNGIGKITVAIFFENLLKLIKKKF